MAFYLRKLGRTFRLVPTTKSLGHSTRINEGDRKEDGHQLLKSIQCVSGFQGTDLTDPALLPSSLIPLSVRDMSLVLLPRLETQGCHSLCQHSDMSEHLMNVAKTVPFTSDDILPASLYPLHSDKGLIVERVVLNMQHPSYDSNKDNVFNIDDELFRQGSQTTLPAGMNTKSLMNDTDFMLGDNFNTLFMDGCASRIPSSSFLLYSTVGESKDKSEKNKRGPSAEQLHSVKGKLERAVKMMFTTSHDYSILHKDVVLQNNLFGDNAIRRGPTAYALELLKLRLRIHTRFSNTTMEVMNTTVNEETGVIRIHWRLSGLPMTEMFKFWRVFQEREEVAKEDYLWFEAFSYFHIGKDGLVRKHKIDRMLPGSDQPEKLPSKLRKLLNPAKPLVT